MSKYLLIILAFLLTSCKEEDTTYRDIFRGGNVYEVEKRIEASESIHIDGPCLSACTFVLFDRYRDKVTWTDRSWFGFHAVKNEKDNKINSLATVILFSELPREVQKELPPLQTWRETLYIISGARMKELLNEQRGG